MKLKHLKRLFVLISLVSLSFLIGCTGMQYAPEKGIAYYPVEMLAAEQAIANAQKMGKDKQCPAEFNEAKNMKDKAFEVYWSCRTKDGIAMAKEATQKANALCPAPPPPPKPAPKVIDRMSLILHFDFDKSIIKDKDKPELERGINFIKKYPEAAVRLEGNTDGKGTEEYNQRLSERRADAVKQYILNKHATRESRITAVGYGKSNPVASNDTDEGRAKNRRVEILILSE
jgi:outer membrane protein OmpA-like peptidoglycan-associated protein